MLSTSDRANKQGAAPKPYQKPTLVKGPRLAQVTADTAKVSGISQDSDT
jgi:hypothetical protein